MLSQYLLLQEMCKIFAGQPDKIRHMMTVHSFALLIAESEGIDPEQQTILGAAALIHDLKSQAASQEADPLAAPVPDMSRAVLAKLSCDPPLIDRICHLAEMHMSADTEDEKELQILIEANQLVHLYEDGASEKGIGEIYRRDFRTETGKNLCKTVYKDCFEEDPVL